MRTAIIPISEAGMESARLLRKEIADSSLFTTREEADGTHIDSIGAFMKDAFHQWDAFIFIGAMGVCVRSIAPVLHDKYTDPAVVCVDVQSQHAISVLSGHIGGANELTRMVANILGATPVITTQSDCYGWWPLDVLGRRFGWHSFVRHRESGHPVASPDMYEAIRLFVAGEPTALLLEIRDKGTGWLESHLPPHVKVFYRQEEIDYSRFRLLLSVSYRLPAETPLPYVCYVAPAVHVGMGLARQASPAAGIWQAICDRLQACRIPPQAIASVATIDIKQEEPVVQMLQSQYPVRFYKAEDLEQVQVPHPSETVKKHTGTSSVCEAAAMLSSGSYSLLMEKEKGADYTVAAALEVGKKREGHIEIVGAGPGDPELISVRGKQLLEQADLILYAGSLVPRELTLYAKEGATVCSSASMDLEEQFELMKRFYDRGLLVVRLHTGDPCIYGAIQEQMNYFDRYGIDYHITPGISSFQAAAAALKSQFTIPEKVQSIILTRGEGRTPMPEREKLHLMARSQSTMCIFLSAAIADEVQKELLTEYPPTTPVAVCYHLTWPDEQIFRGELKNLAEIIHTHHLTLTTMIVVGEAIGNREGLSRLYAHEFKHLFRP